MFSEKKDNILWTKSIFLEMKQRIFTAELFVTLINVRENRHYLTENKNEYEVMSEGKKRD